MLSKIGYEHLYQLINLTARFLDRFIKSNFIQLVMEYYFKSN